MRIRFPALIVTLAFYIALAQPGMPACWLEAQPCEAHVHFDKTQAGSPHSHDYLFDLSKVQDSPGVSLLFIPISLLITLLFLVQVSREIPNLTLGGRGWVSSPDSPPPRFSFSPD